MYFDSASSLNYEGYWRDTIFGAIARNCHFSYEWESVHVSSSTEMNIISPNHLFHHSDSSTGGRVFMWHHHATSLREHDLVRGEM
jgi:hypothetical protein